MGVDKPSSYPNALKIIAPANATVMADAAFYISPCFLIGFPRFMASRTFMVRTSGSLKPSSCRRCARKLSASTSKHSLQPEFFHHVSFHPHARHSNLSSQCSFQTYDRHCGQIITTVHVASVGGRHRLTDR